MDSDEQAFAKQGGAVSHPRVLMITQKVDLDDDILGFTHTWVNKLAERVKKQAREGQQWK